MLNGSKTMILSLGYKIGFMRKFCGIEYAKALGYSVCPYTRLPSSVSLVHPKKSTLVVTSVCMEIFRVFRRGRGSKIGNPIVGSNAIYVVNLLFWPRSIDVHPNQPMRQVEAAEYSNANVIAIGAVPGDVPYLHSVRWPNSPVEIASFWVVIKNAAQVLCGKIGLSHAVVPCKQWFGQKPRRVISTSGLRHFSAYLFRCTA